MQLRKFSFSHRTFFLMLAFSMAIFKSSGQTDTLHLNYYLSQVMPHDTTSAKIDKWVASLKGQHVNITVAAYYHRPEFKKFAQQRCDELFLVLNRKARALITIESIGPRKGKDFQRSMVDIIFVKPGTVAAAPETSRGDATAKENKAERKPAAPGKKKEPEEKQKKDEMPDNGANSHKETVEPPASTEAVTNNTEYRNHTVVLVQPGENSEKVAKFEKKGDGAGLAAYREEMKVLGESLSRMFNENWKDTKVTVVKESELGAVNFSELGNWIFMKAGTSEVSNIDFLTLDVQAGSGSGPGGAGGKMFRVSLMDKTANDGDILVLLHKLKIYFNLRKEFDRSKLQELLAARTLNFSPDQSELNGSEFTKSYRYPYEIVYRETLLNKIGRKEKGVLYLRPDVYNGSVNLMIVDAETGAILSRTSKTAGIKVKESTIKELSDERKQLSDINPLTIY
jgi:hypothetical protein